MPRTATGSKKPKSTSRQSKSEHRRAERGKLKLLTAYRCVDGDAAGLTCFARALNLSEVGTLLESPDQLPVGQNLALEFLMDNNRIVQVEGHVTRVNKHKAFYHIAVDFEPVPATTRHLLSHQVGL